jgi:hypothetical protein
VPPRRRPEDLRALREAFEEGVAAEAVAARFAHLPDDAAGPGPRVGPWTRRLIGAAGAARGELSDAEVRRRHRDHLERKHA